MRVGHRTCKKGQARHGLGGVYGVLIVVPMSMEMRIFSSPWYLSLGETSIVEVLIKREISAQPARHMHSGIVARYQPK